MFNKIIRNIPGFRSGVTWKKIVAVILYFLIFIFTLVWFTVPHDTFTDGDRLYELGTSFLYYFTFFIVPYVLITNIFHIRDKLPLFRKKTFGGAVLGIVCTTLLLTLLSLVLTSALASLQSPEYRQLLQEKQRTREEERSVLQAEREAKIAEERAKKADEEAAAKALKDQEKELKSQSEQYFKEASNLYKAGSYAEALEIFKKVKEIDAKNYKTAQKRITEITDKLFNTYFDKAKDVAEDEKYSEAISYIDIALSYKHDIEAENTKRNYLSKQNEIERLERELIEKSSESFENAKLMEEKGDYEKAKEYYLQVKEKDTENYKAAQSRIKELNNIIYSDYLAKAELAASEGNYEIAMGYLDKALVIKSDDEIMDLYSLYRMENYKKGCEEIHYTDLARFTNNYIGEKLIVYGKVLQVIEDGNDIIMRVAVYEGEDLSYDDVILVNYTMKTDEPYLLEDDRIILWGEVLGRKTYKSVLGASITVPEIKAKYLEINN